MVKKCKKCLLDREETDYYISKGYRSHICKTCEKTRIQSRYLSKQSELQQYGRKHYQQNSEKYKFRIKKWRKDNHERSVKARAEYYQKNKKEIIRKCKIYRYAKLKSNEGFKILCNLRIRINTALKNNSKSKTTKQLLGCSVDELKVYLQSKFTKGMSWDNYGKWHIDHIRPCASFNLTDPEQQKQCFHFTNLQPLWAKDNLSKGAKLI
jgi:hypothetical protein